MICETSFVAIFWNPLGTPKQKTQRFSAKPLILVASRSGVEDGLYGRISQNALIEFYRSKNKIYDGKLSDQKIEELDNECRKGQKFGGQKISLFLLAQKHLHYPFCHIDKILVEQLLDITAKEMDFGYVP